jgi:hypothetical protein
MSLIWFGWPLKYDGLLTSADVMVKYDGFLDLLKCEDLRYEKVVVSSLLGMEQIYDVN